ncbi:D-proline reductase (dithiol) PrdB [Alteribacillus iranensis]|uniref:D-proline reductase (Dithiol) PrdB n=1 Tax=Alteribacillus iranensis TaxID=930128 RepID=A0A1I2E8M8_9BACI|nr:D-proline reductase (dithiol) PrdB [Alteribacillus iranensis]
MRKRLRHEFFKQKAKGMIEKNDGPVELSIPKKERNQWKVAFLTTAGVHLKSDPIFQVEEGDYSLRYIPNNAKQTDLMISHTHYDTSDAKKDISCVFPLEQLKDLEAEGEIGGLSSMHIGMMGYIPNTQALIDNSVPKIIKLLEKENVNILLLSPG